MRETVFLEKRLKVPGFSYCFFFTFLQYTTGSFSEKISNRTTLRHHLHGKNLRRAVSV